MDVSESCPTTTMSPPNHSPKSVTRALRLMVLGLMLIPVAQAQTTFFWDKNGNTSGAGTSNGTWSTNNGVGNRNWTTSSAGTTNTQSWDSGNFAVFSAGTDNTGNFTVTVSGTQNVGGITVEEGNPTISDGTLNFNSANPFVDVGSGRTITFNSQLSGSSGLLKDGAGTMILNSTGNNWTGDFAINAGTVQLNTSHVIPDGSAVSVASGSTLLLNSGVSETLGSLAGAGTVNFRTGTLTVGDSTSTTFSGVLQNVSGFLVKQGTGSLTLSGNSTYSGTTTINAGVLVAASNTALGSSTWGNTIASGAALHLQDNISLTEGSFNVTGTGVGGTGAIRNLSGNNTLNATLALGDTTRFVSDAGTLTTTGQINLGANLLTVAGAGNTTLAGPIISSGGITQDGSGTLTLSGTSANSFSGTLAINDGTVALAKTAGTNAIGGGAVNIGDGSGTAGSAVLRLDASNQIASYADLITLNADGVLQMNNFTESINTIGGTGLIDLATSGYLTVGVNSGSSTFGGSIAGTGTLEKAGSGTLTFTENIAIAGTLRLSGGTLALGDIDLSADTLLVTGDSIIDFGGASSLNVSNLTISDGVTLTIQNWADTVDYFFTQNWAGAVFEVRGDSPMNRVVFTGFSANDTKWQEYDNQITPVPEPSTYGALLLATAGGLLAWRRWRLVRRTTA